MQKKKPQRPQRPRTRRWVTDQGQKWLKLEPARLAPIGGLFFAACTMLLYLVRLFLGQEIDTQRIVASVAMTFLVSYTGTGFYVWYILRLAENELDDQPVAKSTRGHSLDGTVGDYDTAQDVGHEPAEFEENP